MELGQHPAHGHETYDAFIGRAALQKTGKRRWNKRVERAIQQLATLLNFDQLHIGGGNARHLTITLPANARIESNDAGIEGGAALWRDPKTPPPAKAIKAS
jgi:polyphosphate glucokinase